MTIVFGNLIEDGHGGKLYQCVFKTDREVELKDSNKYQKRIK